MAEQGTHKPLVGGSNPPVATFLFTLQVDMDRRKTLINQYKQRKVIGGIYRVNNTRNGMYLLGHAADLQAKKNSFDFMLSTGSCFDYKLKKDIAEFGNKAFNFEVLETLEKKNEQSREEFEDDLNVLHQIWKDSLDPAKRY